MTAPTSAAGGFAGRRPRHRASDIAEGCGGARVIDFAICLILGVTVVSLLLAAL